MASSEDFAQFTRNFPFVWGGEYNVIQDTFEDWHEQRRLISASPRYDFSINFYPITKTEALAIKAFYDARHGPYESFKFTNPIDEIKYTVKFLTPKLDIKRTAFNTYKMSVELQKVF